jgi:hypothetical protein
MSYALNTPAAISTIEKPFIAKYKAKGILDHETENLQF